ncbi:VOC family protein [Chitinophaga sp. CC14]|uniref:VOC family protein n=1 Tax=Chitinophaga TaxID=79328 RepID=UPI000DB93124|nr:VOC family protein [Chitinophaga ginsengisegetis]MDR6568954.1 two-component system sensor histidine kinase QseC [Chitinophaga ginsengisegetis]MDR6649017.1 two-component system sensor histidine kinase QseC [Chitinophaga ginsengisegetis]MDR6655035.1 two-component system sensor histidine kinase QseC [Chitinophaga ginsengisegetis]
MQKITPSLWFNMNAEEAISFYSSIFKNSKVTDKSYYGEGSPIPAGTLLAATFHLEGQEFLAINAGPQFPFTEAISFTVYCENQEEVDYYWSKLTADGGKEVQCGWLKDKFGLSWQITPTIMSKFLSDPDKEKSGRAMQAMMKMVKLDIAALEKAFNGK